jgi:ABC-type transport system involved in multi-copper enzyme maturation permease subunit
MIRLIKIELRKILPSRMFWILAILYVVLLALVFAGTQGFINKVASDAGQRSPIPIPEISIYTFPGIWHNLTFIAGYFKVFLAVMVIIMITNEFSYRTIRQNVMAGMSRLDFLKSKILSIVMISIAATALILIIGLVLGFIYSNDYTISAIFSRTIFLLGYLLEIFSFLVFAFFIGFLVKRSGFAIGLLLLYYVVIEPIVVYKLPDEWEVVMPLNNIANLIDVPNTALMKLFGVEFQDYIAIGDVALVTGYTALFLGITYLVLIKRDL